MSNVYNKRLVTPILWDRCNNFSYKNTLKISGSMWKSIIINNILVNCIIFQNFGVVVSLFLMWFILIFGLPSYLTRNATRFSLIFKTYISRLSQYFLPPPHLIPPVLKTEIRGVGMWGKVETECNGNSMVSTRETLSKTPGNAVHGILNRLTSITRQGLK